MSYVEILNLLNSKHYSIRNYTSHASVFGKKIQQQKTGIEVNKTSKENQFHQACLTNSGLASNLSTTIKILMMAQFHLSGTTNIYLHSFCTMGQQLVKSTICQLKYADKTKSNMNYNEQVFILLDMPISLSMLHFETQSSLSLQIVQSVHFNVTDWQ